MNGKCLGHCEFNMDTNCVITKWPLYVFVCIFDRFTWKSLMKCALQRSTITYLSLLDLIITKITPFSHVSRIQNKIGHQLNRLINRSRKVNVCNWGNGKWSFVRWWMVIFYSLRIFSFLFLFGVVSMVLLTIMFNEYVIIVKSMPNTQWKDEPEKCEIRLI